MHFNPLKIQCSIIVSNSMHVYKCILFCVLQGEGEEVFLELFEDEYSNEKVHTVQYSIMYSYMYMYSRVSCFTCY